VPARSGWNILVASPRLRAHSSAQVSGAFGTPADDCGIVGKTSNDALYRFAVSSLTVTQIATCLAKLFPGWFATVNEAAMSSYQWGHCSDLPP
jgi:hypothetical protein